MADASDYSHNRRAVADALRARLTESMVSLYDLEGMPAVISAIDAVRTELGRRRDALTRQGWIV